MEWQITFVGQGEIPNLSLDENPRSIPSLAGVCVCVYGSVCINVCVCAKMYQCLCVYMYINMYVFVYMIPEFVEYV